LFTDVIIYKFKFTLFIFYFQEEKSKKYKTAFYLNAAQFKYFSNSEGRKLKFIERKWLINKIPVL